MAVLYKSNPALFSRDRRLGLPTNWVRLQLTVIMKLNPTGTTVSGPCIGWVVFLVMLASVMIGLHAGLLYSYQNKHPGIMSKTNNLQQD